jgi:uncharacterized damage-inducible protein DinB
MDLRYPIGKPDWKSPMADAHRASALRDIEALPGQLRAAVEGLSEAQLDTPYREGGWTIRQVVHHLADSHINSYLRVRFALTQENPTIMPYPEALWAELEDARCAPVELSLRLLEGLHARWHRLLAGLDEAGRARTMIHPENGAMTVEQVIALYAWHGRHHLAHIQNTFVS